MTVVAIMQPTFLPWIGYFGMMDIADIFVFLDSVQFSRRSWQQRNRIKTAHGTRLLTVPVISRGRAAQLILDARIDTSRQFAVKQLRTIKQAYGRTPFFRRYFENLADQMTNGSEFLGDYNIGLIEWIMDVLGIECQLRRSSGLNAGGHRTTLLCGICREVGANHYLAASGSRDYMRESTDFEKEGIDVSYFRFDHPTYPQLHGEFVPFLSMIDLLFNVGDESLGIVRQGYNGV